MKEVSMTISCSSWALRDSPTSRVLGLYYRDTYVIDLTVDDIDELWSIFDVYLGPERDSTGTKDSQ